MLGAERLFVDFEHSFEMRSSEREIAEVFQNQREVCEGDGDVWMICAERLFLDRQRAFEIARFCLSERPMR